MARVRSLLELGRTGHADEARSAPEDAELMDYDGTACEVGPGAVAACVGPGC